MAEIKNIVSRPTIVTPKIPESPTQVLTSQPLITAPQKVGKVSFCPYVDVTLNNVTSWSQKHESMQPDLKKVITESKLNKLRLAFVTSKPGICEPTFAGYDVASGFGSQICKDLKKEGVELTISLGGANGVYLEQTCKSTQELTAAYRQIITAYDPKGLDFDLEGEFESHHKGKLDTMMQAIKTIQTENSTLDIIFTLPVLPTGLVLGNGLGILEKAAAHKLNFAVNIMAMDYGSKFSAKSMGEYAIDAATATFTQLKQACIKNSLNLPDSVLWSKIQVTSMIGINDTAPQNFSKEDVVTLRKFSEKVGLGMLSCWSLNRDHSGGSSHAEIFFSGLNPVTGRPNQDADWEYTRLFSGQ